jgi:predicted HTH domain antitoxin
MNLTLPIPDDIGQRLSAEGDDLSRRALEAFAVEEYRAGRLTLAELRRLLGFATRYELDGFLKAREIFEPFTLEDLEQDLRDLKRVGL